MTKNETIAAALAIASWWADMPDAIGEECGDALLETLQHQIGGMLEAHDWTEEEEEAIAILDVAALQAIHDGANAA